jgi:hypothetical protein
MATAKEMRIRAENVLQHAAQIAGECMLENKEQIIPLLVAQQYEQHTDSEGLPLREYRPNTRLHKLMQGKSGKTDFDETGEFHGEMNLSVDETEYSFNSPARTDKGELKSDWLNDWNGSETMNLTPENKELVFPIIRDSFITKVSEELGLD